jgi:hypothetical protein
MSLTRLIEEMSWISGYRARGTAHAFISRLTLKTVKSKDDRSGLWVMAETGK